MFEIEKGIEIPEKHSGRKRKYPFREMEVKDFFFVLDGKSEVIASALGTEKRKSGVKFTCRTVSRCLTCKKIVDLDLFCKTCDKIMQEKEVEKGVGVWRTE